MHLKCLFVIVLCFVAGGLVHPVFADSPVVINEFVVHPSDGSKEWVEFYTDGTTDLNKYWIDDDTDFMSDSGSSAKKQLTSIAQGIDSRHVFFDLPTAIYNNGEDIVALFSPDGTLLDQYHYTNDPGVDAAIGRTPDATGGFDVLLETTRGNTNSVPRPPDTPTPAPTSKPTKEPQETKAPTPKKSTSTESTKSSASTDPTESSWIDDASDSLGSSTKSSSNGARPTAILGIGTKSAEKKNQTKAKKEVLVKGATSSVVPLVATSFGGLFFLSCGILLYVKKKGFWNK